VCTVIQVRRSLRDLLPCLLVGERRTSTAQHSTSPTYPRTYPLHHSANAFPPTHSNDEEKDTRGPEKRSAVEQGQGEEKQCGGQDHDVCVCVYVYLYIPVYFPQYSKHNNKQSQ
jgi:hypothetical protein